MQPDLCQDFGHGSSRNQATIGIASGFRVRNLDTGQYIVENKQGRRRCLDALLLDKKEGEVHLGVSKFSEDS